MGLVSNLTWQNVQKVSLKTPKKKVVFTVAHPKQSYHRHPFLAETFYISIPQKPAAHL